MMLDFFLIICCLKRARLICVWQTWDGTWSTTVLVPWWTSSRGFLTRRSKRPN